MNIERDAEGKIITINDAGDEINPYITTLAAIELQQRIIPPMIPVLTSKGWDIVVAALKEAISYTGKVTPHPETIAPALNADQIAHAVPSENNPPATTVASTPKKPMKPTYKVG